MNNLEVSKDIVQKMKKDLEKIKINQNENQELVVLFNDLSFIFFETFRLLEEIREADKTSKQEQRHASFYNLIAIPSVGNPKLEVLDFIKKELNGCMKIEIFDPYFVGASDSKEIEYLDYVKEIAGIFVSLDIRDVVIHHSTKNQKLKTTIDRIFSENEISIKFETKYKDFLHDRVWIGTQVDDSEEIKVGLTFGSSFNQVFEKPLLYNKLSAQDSIDYQSAMETVLKQKKF